MGLAIFLAMNVMLIAAGVYAGWLDGMDERDAALFRWLSLALATPSALWCAGPLYRRALVGLRHGVLHVDLPVSIGVLAMYVHALWATVTGREAYLDSLTMLVALLLAGRVVEEGGRRRSVEAAQALAGSAPQRARRLVDGDARIEEVAVESLRVGDRLELGAGETVGADAVVRSGEGLVRMALLTGESEPVRVGAGDRVYAGALLERGALTMEVVASGENTLLAGAVRELAQAADRPFASSLPDRVAPWFTGATLGVAALAFTGWTAGAGLETGGKVAMSILVVACPCALALAAPLASAAGLGAAARRGLLVRSGDVLVRLAEVDLVALDKTGTLTDGSPAVVAADPAVLRIAAGLERNSVHPIARAIVAAASEQGIALPAVSGVVEEAGAGITGIVDGRRWRLGGACDHRTDHR
jgi:cation transport ATPase